MTKRPHHQRTHEIRWAAVQARDPDADGSFFYSVRSTGVFCQPSCGARLPLYDNVAFHLTADDAVAAGFRPCRRCRPTSPPRAEVHAAVVAMLCRLIESEDRAPTLASLAAAAGWSTSHTQRTFKTTTGITPKQFFDAHQASRVRDGLDRSQSVTDAMYEAGFQSSGRFYAKADAMLGMTPTEFRRGAPELSIVYATANCSLGWVLVAATVRGVCSILLGDDPKQLELDVKARFTRASFSDADADFERVVSLVIALIDGPKSDAALPLDIVGTAFQKRVWTALAKIPRGQTASYATIANAIGSPSSARAVAQACAANPIAVAIPCHRVVRRDGSLSGYRWGVERKRALLDREQKS